MKLSFASIDQLRQNFILLCNTLFTKQNSYYARIKYDKKHRRKFIEPKPGLSYAVRQAQVKACGLMIELV